MTSGPGMSSSSSDVTNSSSNVTEFSMGVGGPLGFGGNISPAKLTFVNGLIDEPYKADQAEGKNTAPRLLEVRIHGVGASSPPQILEQTDYVQVGGDSLAQFIRRWGSRLPPGPE